MTVSAHAVHSKLRKQNINKNNFTLSKRKRYRMAPCEVDNKNRTQI